MLGLGLLVVYIVGSIMLYICCVAWTKDNTKHDDTLVNLGQEMADIIEKVTIAEYFLNCIFPCMHLYALVVDESITTALCMRAYVCNAWVTTRRYMVCITPLRSLSTSISALESPQIGKY